MKKVISLVLALCMMVSLLFTFTITASAGGAGTGGGAADYNYGGKYSYKGYTYTYSILDEKILITEISGGDSPIIPATIEGYPVTEITNYWANNFKSINVEPDSKYFTSVNGVLFSKDKTVLIAFPGKNDTTEYSVPAGTKIIAEAAFCGNGNKLKKVVLPNSVTTIGREAFSVCEFLNNINIPSSVTVIEKGAFNDCGNLASISIPKSVTSIYEDSFVTNGFKLKEFKTIDGQEVPIMDEAPPMNVYYSGSETEWNNIVKTYEYSEIDGDVVLPKIHFNSKLAETLGSSYSNEVKVTVNGKSIEFDQKPFIQNGRTLVPLRAIFEALGATVNWNNDTRTVTSERNNTKISLAIGSNQLYVNGVAKTIDVPAQIVNGRTMVPARAVAEAFGCDVSWDNNTRTAIIKE